MKCLLSTMILLLLWSTAVHGQKNDYIWYFGYGTHTPPEDSMWGRGILNFHHLGRQDFLQYDGYGIIDFHRTATVANNSEGNFLFAFNGYKIEDAEHKTMPNAENMSEYSNPGSAGLPGVQTTMVLPLPGSDDRKWLVFQQSFDIYGILVAGKRLYYSIVDMEKNGGRGEVVLKKEVLIDELGAMEFGKMTAVRHANGRDWWVILPGVKQRDMFHRLLVTPSGVEMLSPQHTGMDHKSGLGNGVFSPDGSKYAHYTNINEEEGDWLHLYDFDRCSGLLSDPKSFHYDVKENLDGAGTVSFSPSGRYMYLSILFHVYQFDLMSEDVFSTQQLVAVKDDYVETYPPFVLKPSFFQSQLGPDGRIYIASLNSVRAMTTIDYPDEGGESCQVTQQSVHLPTINISMNYFPNYRLGPVDGSLCDTLGIDNVPLSRFRGDQVAEDDLSFRFVDLSAYEPESWFWEFGDGRVSEERHPRHRYEEEGTYEVCLTVENQNGSDRSCETYVLGTVSSVERRESVLIRVYPNPVADVLHMTVEDHVSSAVLSVYDLQGREVYLGDLYQGYNRISTGDWMPGMYIYHISESGVMIGTGKVVKQ